MVNSHFHRILVFQTAFLGDAILSIPLLKELKKKYPHARLGFVCRRGVGAFFQAAGVCDEVIEVQKNNAKSLAEAFLRTKEFKADLILSTHRSFRTAFWVWRLGAAMTVGYADPWSFFAYKKRVPRVLAKHDVLRQLSLMEPLGVVADEGDARSASLIVKLPENTRFEKFENFVTLSPGSQWNTKRWTPSGYREVAQSYVDQGTQLILVGTSGERPLCDEIAKGLSHVTNLAGETSVLELAQLIKKSKLVICNDSGTMHVAASVGTPVVSIFGPTVAAQGYAPWTEKGVIVEVPLDCRPCGRHGHDVCPIGTHDCMKKVSSLQVLKAAERLES